MLGTTVEDDSVTQLQLGVLFDWLAVDIHSRHFLRIALLGQGRHCDLAAVILKDAVPLFDAQPFELDISLSAHYHLLLFQYVHDSVRNEGVLIHVDDVRVAISVLLRHVTALLLLLLLQFFGIFQLLLPRLLQLFHHPLVLFLLPLILHLQLLHLLGARAASFATSWDHLSFHQLFQLLVLLSQLANELVGGVLVHHRGVLDLLSAIGIAEGGEGLVVVDVGGREGGNHDRLRVSAQRVLQQPGESRVTVWHEHSLLASTFFSQRRYDIAKHSQRLVDVRTLFQPVTTCACTGHTLAASQVDQVDF
mmetsp:Transcript_47391/g.122602  ORF Transcript_47391/g.122602 Transcript_47391/m.122602 type:complete len:306 (+) Transcript_47391:2870-3787(+)